MFWPSFVTKRVEMKNLGSEPARGKINSPDTSQGLVIWLFQASLEVDSEFVLKDIIYEIDLAPY